MKKVFLLAVALLPASEMNRVASNYREALRKEEIVREKKREAEQIEGIRNGILSSAKNGFKLISAPEGMPCDEIDKALSLKKLGYKLTTATLNVPHCAANTMEPPCVISKEINCEISWGDK